jgi:hypothetical protein
MMRASLKRGENALWTLCAAAAAISLGLIAGHLVGFLVGIATLLPLASHARWVGLRRAITEPTAATIVLYFYVFVFPLRGLAMVAGDFSGLVLVRGSVSTSELVSLLLLASLGTTAFVEAFHTVRRRQAAVRRDGVTHDPSAASVSLLAGLLTVLALAALVAVAFGAGGFAGAQEQFISHSKEEALVGTRNLALSIWATLAVPAVWCAAYAALRRGAGRVTRVAFIAAIVAILLAQILVFGSRLSVLLALTGVWVMLHYLRGSISIARVAVAVPILILVSVPIISQRPGGDLSRLPAFERYSQIAGYSVLDVALAVRQQPQSFRGRLREPDRWVDLPLYLVPSVAWEGRPNFELRRMDLYVAQTLGDRNHQDTGYPTSYITELWLYGGWPAVLIGSFLFGALAGWIDRRLVGGPGIPSPSALLWYCFLITCAFSYYKDGDLVMNILGDSKRGFYLALAMLASGVWSPLALQRARSFRAHGLGAPTSSPPTA